MIVRENVMTIVQVCDSDSQVMQTSFTIQYHQQFTKVTIDDNVLLQKIYRLQLQGKTLGEEGPNRHIITQFTV